jgi:hypothetical protein
MFEIDFPCCSCGPHSALVPGTLFEHHLLRDPQWPLALGSPPPAVMEVYDVDDAHVWYRHHRYVGAVGGFKAVRAAFEKEYAESLTSVGGLV